MLVKRVNSRPAQTSLLPRAVNSTLQTCIYLMQLAHLHKQAHGVSSTPSTRPFICIYSPNLAPGPPPSQKHTPSARAHPDNKNMTIHTLRAGEGKPGPCLLKKKKKKSSQLRAGHTLCTSKNVRWFVGSSPSHLHFLQQTFDCD